MPYLFEIRVISLRIFIQSTLSLTEFDALFSIVTELNKCLSIFLSKKEIFYYSPDLGNT